MGDFVNIQQINKVSVLLQCYAVVMEKREVRLFDKKK